MTVKTLQKYQCEVCHTEYAQKPDAEKCEKNHKTPTGIRSARHIPMPQNGQGYPVSIDVEMSDGRVLTYKR